MKKTKSSKRVVVVTGDVTMDWNLARCAPPQGGIWNPGGLSRLYWQRGGAALLADLIEAVARVSGQEVEIYRTGMPQDTDKPGGVHCHHSFALWRLFNLKNQSTSARENRVWRVEQFLGVEPARESDESTGEELKKVRHDPPDATLVVLDDANLGFRDCEELWPRALAGQGQPWVIVKMSSPIVQGSLWDHIHSNHADRLIALMTANDLRLTEVQISRGLSWERTTQDLAWELLHNPQINALSDCAYVVISFNIAGAFILIRKERNASGGRLQEQVLPECSLLFDPELGEEDGQPDPAQGAMMGYNSCLATALAYEVILSPEQPDIWRGVQRGLGAIRNLYAGGYGSVGAGPNDAEVSFPVSRIVKAISNETDAFAKAQVPIPIRTHMDASRLQDSDPPSWSILTDRYTSDLSELAENMVLRGIASSLKGVPLGRFGHFVTADRKEIESLRSIQALIREHCHKKQQDRPLSIAVFGSPGSGKSFAITEVTRSILAGRVAAHTFNLSQFEGPENLLGALHRVRDIALSGKMPLVFWDEFDTALQGRPLGWLAHFLAPMQDGQFQEGQLTHYIGPAIFVFAGGTSESLASFGKEIGNEEFRRLKGPDFLSRLKGYVNILGPNPGHDKAASDPHFVIRRAVILRSILERWAAHLFHEHDGEKLLSIDPGVLRAFINTRTYKHGVRSIESIITMSLLEGKQRFERSSLPSEEQLNLHVDGFDFLFRVHQIRLEGSLLEKLAEAIHETFCEKRRSEGYRYGAKTDAKGKTHSSLVPYRDLPEDEKEQNRDNVREIPNKLASEGYVMLPARSGEPEGFEFSEEETERLARMEHERWMRTKVDAGWRWGPETMKESRLHKDLVPWDPLSEEERRERYSQEVLKALGPGCLEDKAKEKDLDLVRQIPKIVQAVGYRILSRKRSVRQEE